MDFERFDKRGYPVIAARDGYREWAATYEDTVKDEMDLAVLAALHTVAWDRVRCAADLGCGTGRTGDWLTSRGVRRIDGVDITPEMLDRARIKHVYQSLVSADVRATGLDGSAYDLVTTVLVDEHLPVLAPLYNEAARLLKPGGRHVLVGYHPSFMIATGMPTHFRRPDGKDVTIGTHLHLLSDHVRAAHAAGLALAEMKERLIDDRWLQLKPKWTPYLGVPFSFALVWER